MPRKNYELWLSFLAISLITTIYLLVSKLQGAVPAASGFFGHSIGVLGFVLMLMTEALYSLRKRSRSVRWGRMASWLNFHIFTGIVGPYMVLLHTSWKFNGLAGITLLLTIIIVLSGFIGRYIYTAIPRTTDGIELEAAELQQQLAALDTQIHSGITRPTKELKDLQNRQKMLNRQVTSLATTRRLMSLWHAVHIPIGMALFTAAFIHSLAAIYYATLLR
jgi:hypothetical protein